MEQGTVQEPNLKCWYVFNCQILHINSYPATIFLCPQRNFGRHIVIAPSVRPASCMVHISYILGGRNSKLGVWMHLGMAECRLHFWVTMTLILTSDLVFIVVTMSVRLSIRPSRFVSGAYLLYSLR